jgi:hypothetical protein
MIVLAVAALAGLGISILLPRNPLPTAAAEAVPSGAPRDVLDPAV